MTQATASIEPVARLEKKIDGFFRPISAFDSMTSFQRSMGWITRIRREARTVKNARSVLGRFSRMSISQMLSDGEMLEVVSAIAGHGRSSTTADMYRTLCEDEKRAAVNSLSQRRAKRVSAVS